MGTPSSATVAAATDLSPCTIMGAGLVGSLLALYLARRGHQVDVYERRADPRLSGAVEGRSINLALSDRGWRALEGVGISEQVREVAIPMYRRVMHDQQGRLTYQPYGRENQAIYSVSRGGLNRTLLNLTEADPRIRMHFNEHCQHVDLRARRLEMHNTLTDQEQTLPFRRLFGADGAYSAVRGAMQKTDRYEFSQSYLEYGYKELTIEAGPNGEWQLEKNALHIWPRGQYMMIALPNLDGSFNCTLFFPYEGQESFTALETASQVQEFFEERFPDAVPFMPDLAEEFIQNPTGSLITVKCFPWVHKDEIVLLGDASHAIVPFYGQGMNAGFEDCSVLDSLLNQYGEDWHMVFSEFQRQRKPNADAMADLAIYNFEEMRDRVADPRFLLQKKIESKISAQYPDQWLPLYSQVTFSDTPYADAWANGQRQESIMQRLMPHIQTEADYDLPTVQEMVRQEMEKIDSISSLA
ncbi:FAD-dependent monooxygenase [Hymenobacter sp. BT188]|uniref:FAD-dependent oxidoreductase n=1 Tax=Hymenobacter sp. BT188 TaxID=2763504 RepID=UPI0016511E64|nr:NAD(P)/FAD-dependent oxidoreductase [Hymenobacter sp. BT188]MBC6608402.1 FAD-dependent monooxygenase [Hymenobacter sp. BT188]